ncbi:hypothetical protein Ancab_007804 [Ancistrocladus abbreviatus]
MSQSKLELQSKDHHVVGHQQEQGKGKQMGHDSHCLVLDVYTIETFIFKCICKHLYFSPHILILVKDDVILWWL